MAHAFGESVIIGFFKFFPSTAIFIFSSGTGFSYCFSLAFTLTLNYMGIFYGQAFTMMLLFIVPFSLSFEWINKKKIELIGSNS
jgi:hypothetical protein